jgi:Mrp family chromosome partitioning ATPase
MIVYQVGKVARGSLRRAKAQLDHVKAQMLGIVLNGMKVELSPDFTSRDKYNYYYGYGDKDKKPARGDKLKALLPMGWFDKITGLFERFTKK